MTKLERSHPEIMSKITNFYANKSVSEAVSSNAMKINIYYDHMSYTTYEQQASYSDEQFISDLGKL